MSDTKPDFDALSFRASSIFTPSAPINTDELFRGRKSQLRDVVDAINQPGRHVILFGGRGVGKTSLGRILRAKLAAIDPVPIVAPLVTCDSNETYSSIWRKVFLEMRALGHGPPEGESYDKFEDTNTVWTPFDVRRDIEPIAHESLLYVIIDEFDKVECPDARQAMADTIKYFSDHGVPVTLVLIGVGDDVTKLLDDHQSIDRCLSQVSMPRMPAREIESIVEGGLTKLGMSITRRALAEIVGLSRGLPTYAHLLALHSSRQALETGRVNVDADDVQVAITRAIGNSEQSIQLEYSKATLSPRKTIYPQVLLACAMAETDEYGRFQPSDLCQPMQTIMKEPYKTNQFTVHLKEFCEADRGFVLVMGGVEYRRQYYFRNPLLQPYVLMKGLASGMVSKEDLKLQPADDLPLFRTGRK